MTTAPEDLICEAVDNAEQVQPDLQAEIADRAKLSPPPCPMCRRALQSPSPSDAP